MKKFILILLFAQIVTTISHAQCTRANIVGNYNNIYLPSTINMTDLAWTGSTTTCTAGTISDTALARSLRRINYLRELAGVSSNIIYDTSYSRKAQEAALMMSANNTINHAPPTSWLCYTADGASGAGSSNLAYGTHSSGSIAAFMNDAGSGNSAVGHRRWILYSRSTAFGMGSTNNACALWVFGPNMSPPVIDFIAYPSEGFFPAPLVPSSNRWSFSKPGADFNEANITMTDSGGANVSLTISPIAGGYGDNTIVWEPVGINTSGPHDMKYTVQVDSVLVSGTYQSYNYDVIIAQPVHPPSCPVGKIWSENDCMCVSNVGISELANQKVIIAGNPFSDRLNVKLNSNDIRVIRVMNYAGSVISIRNLSGQETNVEWNTSDWAAGIYFIEVLDKDGGLFRVKGMKM